MAEKPVCVVIGVGPGNGESLVRTFSEKGYQVAALARNLERLRELVGHISGVTPYACDATDPDDMERTFKEITNDLGSVDTLLYNAGNAKWGKLMDVTADDLQAAWKVNVQGLFYAAQAVIPIMVKAGTGKIGITGATASLRGKPHTTAFAQAKAAQRSLAQSMAREFGPQGIHVFYFILDGVVDLPRTREMMSDKPDEFFLSPDAIAQSVYAATEQPRRAWTFEFDLRPFGENW